MTTHRLAAGRRFATASTDLLAEVGLSQTSRAGYRTSCRADRPARGDRACARDRATPLVLDEPTASLDVIVQAQILNLLVELQEQTGDRLPRDLHDLAVVRHLSHRIYVMYLGRVVEEGPAGDVLARPSHPYTEALLASVRGTRGATRTTRRLLGETPPAWAVPAGCRFHPRCTRYAELGAPTTCSDEDPRLRAIGDRPHGCLPLRRPCRHAARRRIAQEGRRRAVSTERRLHARETSAAPSALRPSSA